jgi:predicted peroxiredoxin
MTETSHLAILICSAAPDRPELCVTPLIHALAARALDCEVEIHFAGPAIRFLVEGVAGDLYPTSSKEKSILDFIHDASAAGVSFLACSMAQANWVNKHERLIPECHGSAGATAFVVRALDSEWKTLVF